MTSEMQRDIERIEPLIPFDPETREAWQRIRQRLTPDREWQPIETAPKDGETVYLFYDEDTGDFSMGVRAAACALRMITIYPTHWMPLPEPPKETP